MNEDEEIIYTIKKEYENIVYRESINTYVLSLEFSIDTYFGDYDVTLGTLDLSEDFIIDKNGILVPIVVTKVIDNEVTKQSYGYAIINANGQLIVPKQETFLVGNHYNHVKIMQEEIVSLEIANNA